MKVHGPIDPTLLVGNVTMDASIAPTSESSGGLSEEAANFIFYVTFIIMLLFFFTTGAASEKYKPAFGHETTYTVALGLLISVILWYAAGGPQDHEQLAASFTFSSNFFFDFMLPPLVFSSGYTMLKKKFFDNLGNIAINGFCVTIVCFVLYGLGTVALVNMELKMSNPF